MHKIALRNLFRDRQRLAIGVLGIAFSAFLMVFEGSLIVSFARSASRVIDASGGDIWIMPRGIRSLDFSAPVPAVLAHTARFVPGVEAAGQVVIGFSVIVAPDGRRHNVLLIGMDSAIAGGVATPVRFGASEAEEGRIVLDRTSTGALAILERNTDVEINGHRATVVGLGEGFPTFLGSPFAFTTAADAKRLLGRPAREASFVALRLAPGTDVGAATRAIAERYPEFDVLPRSRFSLKSRVFWLLQTGAGGALSLAAILGFLIGLVVISQVIYAITVEHIEEYATLKAVGASNAFVGGVVGIQSLALALIGGLIGFAFAPIAAYLSRDLVAWLAIPSWMYPLVALATLGLCALAALYGARTALAVDPGRVFRA